jgi:hypothetical protein
MVFCWDISNLIDHGRVPEKGKRWGEEELIASLKMTTSPQITIRVLYILDNRSLNLCKRAGSVPAMGCIQAAAFWLRCNPDKSILDKERRIELVI